MLPRYVWPNCSIKPFEFWNNQREATRRQRSKNREKDIQNDITKQIDTIPDMLMYEKPGHNPETQWKFYYLNQWLNRQ